jgi:hypothetical protein
MPNVLLLEKDPFQSGESAALGDAFLGRIENVDVRRPLGGIQVKEPRFAYVSLYQDVVNENALQVVSLLDSSAAGGFSSANHNFILQGVTESRQEKVQVMETFGDDFVFFYGQKPVTLVVQGVLFNTKDFNWKNEFLANYDRFLRGTKCVENRTRVFLGWDDVLAQGYILDLQVSQTSQDPNVVSFAFTMLLSQPPTDLSSSWDALDAPDLEADRPPLWRATEGDTDTPIEYVGLGGLGDPSPAFIFDPVTGDVYNAAEGPPEVPEAPPAPDLGEKPPSEDIQTVVRAVEEELQVGILFADPTQGNTTTWEAVRDGRMPSFLPTVVRETPAWWDARAQAQARLEAGRTVQEQADDQYISLWGESI